MLSSLCNYIGQLARSHLLIFCTFVDLLPANNIFEESKSCGHHMENEMITLAVNGYSEMDGTDKIKPQPEVCKRIKNRIKALDMAYSDVVKGLRHHGYTVSKSTVGNWSNTISPPDHMMDALAEVLGTSRDYLLTGKDIAPTELSSALKAALVGSRKALKKENVHLDDETYDRLVSLVVQRIIDNRPDNKEEAAIKYFLEYLDLISPSR